MNKYLLIVLILFLPIIAAGIWYFSVMQADVTVSGVSTVMLELPDGSQVEYSSDSDKEFFIDFVHNIVPIEKQEYDESVHTLYKLSFERVQGNILYYLCLSADIKNCLAFDSNGDWYRIDKEYAKKFLSTHDTSSVYRNSEVPLMKFISNGITTNVTASEADWFYLLSDESYSEVKAENSGSADLGIYVLSGEMFELSFDVMPDWYGVKVYDGDALIYDGVTGNFFDFTHDKESQLRAVVTAEWYSDTTNLYHGTAVYDLLFDYDIKATYSMDKKEAFGGEVIYVSLMHVDNETLEVTSTLPKPNTLNARAYKDGKIVIVPIPADTPSGEYRLSVKSDKTALSIPFTVKEKNFETVNIGFVNSESAEEYNNAQAVFTEEISLAFDIVLSETNWVNGLLTPVRKYIDGIEQYWISAPSFGVLQKVNGVQIDERSKGIHYVKSVVVDSLTMRAVANGTVAFAGVTSLYGNTVVIEHGLGFKTVYGHIDELKYNVGDNVAAGDTIGVAKPDRFAVSSTEGFFGICVDGVFLNPYNFIKEVYNTESTEVSDPIQFFLDSQSDSID